MYQVREHIAEYDFNEETRKLKIRSNGSQSGLWIERISSRVLFCHLWEDLKNRDISVQLINYALEKEDEVWFKTANIPVISCFYR